MGTEREEAITLRREVGGRTGSGAAMAVAAGCALAGVVLGFGLGRSSVAGPVPAPAEVSVVRPGAPVYAVPCPSAEPRLLLIDDGEDLTSGEHAAARDPELRGEVVAPAEPAP